MSGARGLRAAFAAPIAAAALAIAGCAPPAPGPMETFRWGSQSIAFAPPPAGWRSEGDGGGGRRGVRFVKERSVGEVIGVAEHYLVGDRDRRGECRELAGRAGAMGDQELTRALSLSRWRTEEPWSAAEAAAAAGVNAAIDRAGAALRAGDRAAVRAALEEGEAAAATLSITLHDVADRVVLDPARKAEPGRFRVIARRPLQVAGEPAIALDYTLRTPDRLLEGREVHVVHDNHLFIATFLGLSPNRRLFDRVVESIVFPARERATP